MVFAENAKLHANIICLLVRRYIKVVTVTEEFDIAMDSKKHWDEVYSTKSSTKVSWFQDHAEMSLSLIGKLPLNVHSAIIDVGCGASNLADDLLVLGYLNLTILDLSDSALQVVKQRLGGLFTKVNWQVADITTVSFPMNTFDLWHDRAVFHFLTNEHDRQAYVTAAENSVKPEGYAIVATFADDGPMKCSGLPVQRYSAEALYSLFSASFELISHQNEVHQTPSGASQKFVYCLMRRKAEV